MERGRKGPLRGSSGPHPGQRNRGVVLSALGLCCLVMREHKSKRYFLLTCTSLIPTLPSLLSFCHCLNRITSDKSATSGERAWGRDCSPSLSLSPITSVYTSAPKRELLMWLACRARRYLNFKCSIWSLQTYLWSPTEPFLQRELLINLLYIAFFQHQNLWEQKKVLLIVRILHWESELGMVELVHRGRFSPAVGIQEFWATLQSLKLALPEILEEWVQTHFLPRQTRAFPRFLTPLAPSLIFSACLPTYLPACLTFWSTSYHLSFPALFWLITQTSANDLDLHKGFLLLYPSDLVIITPTLLPGYPLLLVPHPKVPPLLSRDLLEPSPFPIILSPHYPVGSWPNWPPFSRIADSHQMQILLGFLT